MTSAPNRGGTGLAVTALRTDERVEPLGIGSARPRFAWQIESHLPGVLQHAYEIEVATDETFDAETVWRSGWIESETPFGAVYGGTTLESARRYWWRVRVHCSIGDERSELSAWSSATWFETGLLDPARWTARWVGGPPPTSKADDPVLYLRGDADLGSDVVRARAYVTARGWYRLFINTTDVTGPALVPRFTPFDQVLEYQTYDVTHLLHEGVNRIGIAVGDGRYRGSEGLTSAREAYGTRIGAFAQIEAELVDGSCIVITTDEQWMAGTGRITGSDPKHGERVDERISDLDWLDDPIPPARFTRAALLPDDGAVLIAESVERVQEIGRLRGTVHRAPSGAQILDFGQNFAGIVRARLDGPAGTAVRFTFSEVLSPDGELDTDYMFTFGVPLLQRDTVVLAGAPVVFQPWFTIHGFRYVKVVGLERDLDPDDIEGIVLSSALADAGTFECSDRRLEQLHRNVRWSVRSNFTDTPTDCPTRERSGWTGDIQVFAPTAALTVDSHAFLRRYLENLALEQYEDGRVPTFIPSEQPNRPSLGRRIAGIMATSAGWGDAAVLLPWTLYEYYGDRNVLERQYPSMRKWIERMARVARVSGRGRPLRTLGPAGARYERYIVDSDFHFGEWLRPQEVGIRTIARNIVRPPSDVATAYLAHSSRVMARTAAELGRDADARRYGTLSERSRIAWRHAFLKPDGRIAHDRQDDYVRALALDLLLPEQVPAAVQRLVELIETADDHLSTGFLSTPLILKVLVDGGRGDVALRLLLQTTNPSWLYQVERGATTIWETWEGYHEDGRGKESHNHYALGAVARWLTEGLAGISPASPGYRRIRIAPVMTARVHSAGATVRTPFGDASSHWVSAPGEVVLQIAVPPGTEADVIAPDGEVTIVSSGTHRFTWSIDDLSS